MIGNAGAYVYKLDIINYVISFIDKISGEVSLEVETPPDYGIDHPKVATNKGLYLYPKYLTLTLHLH